MGDVDPAEAIPVIDKYFGRIPKGPEPPPVRTVEPEQQGERIVKLKDPAQPLYAEGYHVPDINDPDNAVYEAIATIEEYHQRQGMLTVWLSNFRRV